METKVCYGPLHPEGLELPLNKFSTYSVTCNKVVYHYVRKYCKECLKIYYHKYNTSEKGLRRMRIYQNSEKGKENTRRCANSHRKRHPEKHQEQLRRARQNLYNSYIKNCLRRLGIQNPIPEHIEFRRELINLNRIIKTIKNGSNNRVKQL